MSYYLYTFEKNIFPMAKKILFAVLTIISVWFFVYGIPADVYDTHSLLITIAGGLTTTALLGLAFFQFYPGVENNKDRKNFTYLLIAGLLFFLFGFSTFLYNRGATLREEALIDNGASATGIVKIIGSFKTKSSNSVDLTVEYKLKGGKMFIAVAKVPSRESGKYVPDQEVPIVYSAKYPSIIKIVSENSSSGQLTQKKSRSITYKDLTHLFDLRTRAERVDFLNTINRQWNTESALNGQTTTYYNNLQSLGIKMTDKEITYMHPDNTPKLFEDELATLSYKNDNKGTFANDSYIVVKRTEKLNVNAGQPSKSNKVITLVGIYKK
jgi:hypothetical protein